MVEFKRPMLAVKDKQIDRLLSQLVWPKRGSPKMDGIRGLVPNGVLCTRSLKTVGNRYTQARFSDKAYAGFDGELIVGKPYDFNVMQQTSSGTSRYTGEPDVHFYVFDDFSIDAPFSERLESARYRVARLAVPHIKFVPHEPIDDEAALMAYEERCLLRGYEGVMLRDPRGPYKQGRSTMIENWLVGVKRFEDGYCTIESVHEFTHNDNEATTNELGLTKRSSHKANKRLGGTFGGFTCLTDEGVRFSVGNGRGLDMATRARWWAMRAQLPGKRLKYNYIKVGTKVAPRLPSIIGLCDELGISREDEE